jgi:hypothetical protein
VRTNLAYHRRPSVTTRSHRRAVVSKRHTGLFRFSNEPQLSVDRLTIRD